MKTDNTVKNWISSEPHNFSNNRLTLHDTKHDGTIITSVRNSESVLAIEKEIFERLHNSGGSLASFQYWHNGRSFIANYRYADLHNIFGARTQYQF